MTRLRFLVGGLLLVAAACRDPASGAGTALYVTITYDGTVTQLPTQFSFSARDLTADGGSVFENYLQPQQAAQSGLASPQSALLELSHHPEVVGHTLLLHVDGLAGATVVGSGDSQPPVLVKNGLTVPVGVTIGTGSSGDGGHDGGTDGGIDGGSDAGPGCAGCTGCCQFNQCVVAPNARACGIDGGECAPCSTQSANSCGPFGTCTCGSAPECQGQSDTCLDGGLCSCGDAGTACSGNELCVQGACHCGAGASCSSGTVCNTLGRCVCVLDGGCGCCVPSLDGGDDTCATGNQNAACGVGGEQCQNCLPGTCTNHQCSSCNSANCASGCCLNGSCNDAGFSSCGTAGSACTTCDPKTATACGGGACECGSIAACGSGQHCTSMGTCVCDGTSCPGCCDSSKACNTPDVNTCGIDGGACIRCDQNRSDGCRAGQCSCGDGGECLANQQCVNGACVCNSQSCPNGCCSGNSCVAGTSDQHACGLPGTNCVDCTGGVGANAGNYCCTGVCKCGTLGCGLSPSCSGSQHCDCSLGCACGQ